jgi:hypothetical protein
MQYVAWGMHWTGSAVSGEEQVITHVVRCSARSSKYDTTFTTKLVTTLHTCIKKKQSDAEMLDFIINNN